MANKNETYTIAACATSVWSPQLCQMKHIIISGKSVKSFVYEEFLQHHAVPNCVEVGYGL
jgi:hypothetical protein